MCSLGFIHGEDPMRREAVGGVDVGREGKKQLDAPGIVIVDRNNDEGLRPRVAAFIWGGKVRPTPVLPFGREKGAA